MVAVKAYRGGNVTVTQSGIQKYYVVTDLKNNQVFQCEAQRLKQYVSRCDVCLVFLFYNYS